MRVLVLGTSNSLIRGGWVDGLRQSVPGIDIENRSVGASPGLQFLTHIETDFSKYDYVFLDSIPNDELLFNSNQKKNNRKEYFSKSYYFERMSDIFSTIRSQTNLVLIGIPRVDFFESSSDIFIKRQSAADYYGAAFIDFRDEIRRYAEEKNILICECYEDHPAHPLRKISYNIGCDIGGKIKNNELLNSTEVFENKSKNYKIYSFGDFEVLNKEFRKNSIMDETFAVLKEGESVEFDLSQCVGYYINTKNTYCIATVQDNNGAPIFRTRLFYPRDDNGLLKVFIPLPEGVVGSRIVCSGGFAADAQGPNTQNYDENNKDYVLSISKLCIVKKVG